MVYWSHLKKILPQKPPPQLDSADAATDLWINNYRYISKDDNNWKQEYQNVAYCIIYEIHDI